MIVVDSSAWVEFLRRSESRVDRALTDLVESDEDLAVTEVVVIEVLAGARSVVHAEELRATLLTYPLLRLNGLIGYEAAAALWRACRDAGETIRRLTDCLVAVPAIEAGAAVLHADCDFDKIARHTPLEVVSLDE